MTRAEAIENAERIQGWMSREELGWLYDLSDKYESIVEVGSWRGRSTYALLASGMSVYAVDHWCGSPSELDSCHSDAKTKDIFAEFTENVGSFLDLTIMRGDSKVVAENWDGVADVVFIDAEHTPEAVERDVNAWLPKTKKLLCGHDRDMPGVRQYLNTKPFPWKEGPGSIWYYEIPQ